MTDPAGETQLPSTPWAEYREARSDRESMEPLLICGCLPDQPHRDAELVGIEADEEGKGRPPVCPNVEAFLFPKYPMADKGVELFEMILANPTMPSPVAIGFVMGMLPDDRATRLAALTSTPELDAVARGLLREWLAKFGYTVEQRGLAEGGDEEEKVAGFLAEPPAPNRQARRRRSRSKSGSASSGASGSSKQTSGASTGSAT